MPLKILTRRDGRHVAVNPDAINQMVESDGDRGPYVSIFLRWDGNTDSEGIAHRSMITVRGTLESVHDELA